MTSVPEPVSTTKTLRGRYTTYLPARDPRVGEERWAALARRTLPRRDGPFDPCDPLSVGPFVPTAWVRVELGARRRTTGNGTRHLPSPGQIIQRPCEGAGPSVRRTVSGGVGVGAGRIWDFHFSKIDY